MQCYAVSRKRAKLYATNYKYSNKKLHVQTHFQWKDLLVVHIRDLACIQDDSPCLWRLPDTRYRNEIECILIHHSVGLRSYRARQNDGPLGKSVSQLHVIRTSWGDCCPLVRFGCQIRGRLCLFSCHSRLRRDLARCGSV